MLLIENEESQYANDTYECDCEWVKLGEILFLKTVIIQENIYLSVCRGVGIIRENDDISYLLLIIALCCRHRLTSACLLFPICWWTNYLSHVLTD